MATPLTGLACLCRPGFEPELAAELMHRSAEQGLHGYVRADTGSGLVQWLGTGDTDSLAVSAALPFSGLVFVRQKCALIARLQDLDPADRIGPILAALPDRKWGEVRVEHPDGDATRPLAALARSLGNALRPALRKAGRMPARDDTRRPRLHVVLLGGTDLLLCEARTDDSSPWPMGIPRLRLPAGAPSRSAAKLEEALLTFLDEAQRERWLVPGQQAADLGAAPGGWSWVLARHHLRVHAVDNGPMAASAMDTGVIEHHRADGFRWQPPKPLDWLVCDMVEQPIRVADRMATWLANGWCRHAIFNLKLPMKKRWEETVRCLEHVRENAGPLKQLAARQLYHDREEITVFASRG